MANIISRYSLGSVEKQQERFNGFFRGESESEVSSAYSYTLQRESQSERDGSPTHPLPRLTCPHFLPARLPWQALTCRDHS